MSSGEDSLRAAEDSLRAAEQRNQQSICPAGNETPCKHIRQAATRNHLECVKHFWKWRKEGDEAEEQLQKQALGSALTNKNVEVMNYLCSSGCPWDPRMGTAFLSGLYNRGMISPWDDWRAFYSCVFEHKLADHVMTRNLLRIIMLDGHWDFLEAVHGYGYTFEDVYTKCLADGPNGANIAALRELSTRDAFRTFDLSWVTPMFAVHNNDLPLLEFACLLTPELSPYFKPEIVNELMDALPTDVNKAIVDWLEAFRDSGHQTRD